jgi:hypothetical protein
VQIKVVFYEVFFAEYLDSSEISFDAAAGVDAFPSRISWFS